MLGLSYQRIQFTSDLLPADVIGISIYDRASGRFKFHRGPVFAQLVMADEVNRATPKAQSALLEAMEEHQVTVDGESHALPEPFFIVATQNPSFQVGTFPLPESQIDRFLMRIELGYPAPSHERQLLRGRDRRDVLADLPAALDPAAIPALQKRVAEVHAGDALLDYVQALARASRDGGRHQAGLSPRAVIALLRSAQAWAFLHGHAGVLPEDLQSVLPAVVGHRLRPRDAADGRGPARGRRGAPEIGADPLRTDRHSAAYAAKRALRGWVRDWIRRRQGPDREAVTLRRGRIYILPTGLGLAFGADAVRDAARLAELRQQPGTRAHLPAWRARASSRCTTAIATWKRWSSRLPAPNRRSPVSPPCSGLRSRTRGARRAATSRPTATSGAPPETSVAGRRRGNRRGPRADPAARQHRARARRGRDALSLRPVPCLGGAASRPRRLVYPRLAAAARRHLRFRPRSRAAAAGAEAMTISRDSRTTIRATRRGTSRGRRTRAPASCS